MSLSFLGSLAALVGTQGPLFREAMRSKPIERNAKDATPALYKAMQGRMKQVEAEDIPALKLNPITPDQVISDYKQKMKAKGIYDTESIDSVDLPNALAPLLDQKIVGRHAMMFGKDSNGRPDLNKYLGDQISYNPNADAAVLAHEMGHAVSAKTKAGSIIRHLRNNPKLATALAIATGVVPISAAALTPGDEDLDDAILGTTALAAPTLIDEGLATKNALAMMNSADMRATLGQRGKLASGLLSYLAVPLVAATGGNAIGNLFDQDVPAQ